MSESVATQALIDLLGAFSYVELSAFDTLAEGARMAPTLSARAAMSGLAAAQSGHYERLARRLGELGTAPEVAMEPFVAALETYHSLTEPSTWLEAVAKAYLGGGIAEDF